MGVVYKAEDTRLHRFVALKFLSDEFARDPDALNRFRREARAASALNHPNICTIYDIGEQDGRSFIVMECLDGATLKHRIAGRPLEIETLLRARHRDRRCLGCGPRRGHRPSRHQARQHLRHRARPRQDSRFWIGESRSRPRPSRRHRRNRGAHPHHRRPTDRCGQRDGDGVVHVAGAGPRQAVWTRARIYSRSGWCSMKWRPASCHFAGKAPAIIFDSILNRAPVPPVRLNPDLPAELERIIDKCLEKDRNLRYQHASEIRADLQRLKRDTDSGRRDRCAARTHSPHRQTLEGDCSRCRGCAGVPGRRLPLSSPHTKTH